MFREGVTKHHYTRSDRPLPSPSAIYSVRIARAVLEGFERICRFLLVFFWSKRNTNRCGLAPADPPYRQNLNSNGTESAVLKLCDHVKTLLRWLWFAASSLLILFGRLCFVGSGCLVKKNYSWNCRKSTKNPKNLLLSKAHWALRLLRAC